MAVDTGGLRYQIELIDRFSAATSSFLASVRETQAGIESLRVASEASASTAGRSASAMRSLGDAARVFAAVQRNSTGAVNAHVSALGRLAAQEERLLRIQAQDNARTRGEAAATRNRATLQERQAAAAASLAKSEAKLAAAIAKKSAATNDDRRATAASIKLSRTAASTYDEETKALRRLAAARAAAVAAGARLATPRSGGTRTITPTPLPGRNTGSAGGSGAAGNAAGAGAAAAGAGAAAGAKGLNIFTKSANHSTHASWSLARVLQRLLTAFVFFAAARGIFNAFKAMVSGAIEFNSNIEKATLGVAALLTATGDVRDATGASVDSSRQLALAQVEARRQVAQLRKEALATSATFQEIVETFQLGLAPGLTAGLKVDDIRKLSVQISQAASAIGVPQNQLAEEIRSLLSGTIQPRTTRIATSLGITNQDIKLWKEAGTLAQELQARFEAFSVAGQESLTTFSAVLSNTQDALQQLFGAGSVDFFAQIKGLLTDIQKSVIDITDNGVIIRPEAKLIVEALFRGLASIVAEIRSLQDSLRFDAVYLLAQKIGNVFSAVGKTIAGFIVGMTRGFSDVARIAFTISGLVSGFSGKLTSAFETKGLRDVVAQITEMVVLFFAAQVAIRGTLNLIKLILLPVRGLVLSFNIIKSLVSVIAATFSFLISPVGLVTVAVAALIGLFAFGLVKLQEWIHETTGVNISFKNLIVLIGQGLKRAFEVTFAVIKLGWLYLIDGMKEVFFRLVEGVLYAIKGILVAVQKVAGLFSQEISDGFDKALIGVNEKIDAINKKVAGYDEERKKAAEDLNKLLDEQAKGFREDIVTALTADQTQRSLQQMLKDGADFLGQGIGDLLGKLGVKGLEIPAVIKTDDAVDLVKTLEQLSPVIGAGALGIETMSQEMKTLADDTKKATREFEVATEAINAQGAAVRQRTLQDEAQAAALETTKKITSDIQQREQAMLGLLRQRVALETVVSNLTAEQQNVISDGVRSGREFLRTQDQLSRAKLELTQAEIKAKQTSASFDDDAKKAAQDSLAQARAKFDIAEQASNLARRETQRVLKDLAPEEAAKLAEIISTIIEISGQEVVLEGEKLQLVEDRKTVEGEINAALAKRISALARQEIETLRLEAEATAARLDNDRKLFSAKLDLVEINRKIAESEVGAADESRQLELLRAQQAVDLKKLDLVIEEAKKHGEINDLLAQRNALTAKQNLELQAQQEKLKNAQDRVQATKDIAESPVKFGALQALINFGNDAADAFKFTLGVMTQALEGFTDLVGDAVASALDPTKRFDIVQRFRQFINDLVVYIVKQFIKAQLFKLLLGVGFSSGDVTTLGLASGGFAEGGKIPKGGYSPSLAHMRAKGFTDGGAISVRPQGLDPRDTVPIWAQPGEYMMRFDAVRRYGVQAMEAINRGLIDPMSLRGLAGVSSGVRSAVTMPRRPGYASGGAIPSRFPSTLPQRDGTKIVNLVSPDLLASYMLSDAGQRTIVNVIKNNRQELSS